MAHICFCFFTWKNGNAGTVMLAASVLIVGAFLLSKFLAVFAF